MRLSGDSCFKIRDILMFFFFNFTGTPELKHRTFLFVRDARHPYVLHTLTMYDSGVAEAHLRSGEAVAYLKYRKSSPSSLVSRSFQFFYDTLDVK